MNNKRNIYKGNNAKAIQDARSCQRYESPAPIKFRFRATRFPAHPTNSYFLSLTLFLTLTAIFTSRANELENNSNQLDIFETACAATSYQRANHPGGFHLTLFNNQFVAESCIQDAKSYHCARDQAKSRQFGDISRLLAQQVDETRNSIDLNWNDDINKRFDHINNYLTANQQNIFSTLMDDLKFLFRAYKKKQIADIKNLGKCSEFVADATYNIVKYCIENKKSFKLQKVVIDGFAWDHVYLIRGSNSRDRTIEDSNDIANFLKHLTGRVCDKWNEYVNQDITKMSNPLYRDLSGKAFKKITLETIRTDYNLIHKLPTNAKEYLYELLEMMKINIPNPKKIVKQEVIDNLNIEAKNRLSL